MDRVATARTVLLVRHAESEHNTTRTLSSCAPGLDLSTHGREQAVALARVVRARWQPAAVWASPCLRAQSTAGAIADACRLVVRVSDELREYGLGDLEGASSEEAWQQVDAVFRAWMLEDDLGASLPNGETGASVITRMARAVTVAAAAVPDGCLVLVGHGGAIRTAVPRIVDNIRPAFAYHHPIPNAGIVELSVDASGWTCRSWAGALQTPPGVD